MGVQPGEYLSLEAGGTYEDGSSATLEARLISKTYQHYHWPSPQLTTVIHGEIMIMNNITYKGESNKNCLEKRGFFLQ